jgi:uncharacterized protein (UPF0332 family)
MSPRSREFMDQAADRLGAATLALEGGFFPTALSTAYYAMLYAARAALSEEDRYARTHKGTWDLFQNTFVDAGRFDQSLLSAARRKQEPRERADYDARRFSREEAAETVELAERFLAGVTELIGE